MIEAICNTIFQGSEETCESPTVNWLSTIALGTILSLGTTCLIYKQAKNCLSKRSLSSATEDKKSISENKSETSLQTPQSKTKETEGGKEMNIRASLSKLLIEELKEQLKTRKIKEKSLVSTGTRD